jgi:diguanylate cyclase (GGDEF)-like protein
MISTFSHRRQSTLWTVIIITLSTTLASVSIAEIFAAAMGFHAGWKHYVFALGVPALSTPIWAVPLVRANHQLARMRAELERLARTDPLSGLPNRRAFFERAGRIVSRAKAKAQPIAAMMIDIDRFKSINDMHGHDVGDAVIRAVAGTIDKVISRIDGANDRMVARFGGDEFAVLVTGLDEPKVTGLAAGICTAVRVVNCRHGEEKISISVSAGAAMQQPGESIDALLKSADNAVYEAKGAGRDRSRIAGPGKRRLFRGEASAA